MKTKNNNHYIDLSIPINGIPKIYVSEKEQDAEREELTKLGATTEEINFFFNSYN